MKNKFRIIKNYEKNCYEIYEVFTDEKNAILNRSKRALCLGYQDNFVDISQFLEILKEVEASVYRCVESEKDVYSLDYLDAMIMLNNGKSVSELSDEDILKLAYHSYLAEKSVRHEIDLEVRKRELAFVLEKMLGQ